MEKICKNCKWWGRNKRDEINHGSCDNGNFIYTGQMYSSEKRKLKNNTLLYTDSDCYGAYFETGENFGCIHWEEKA